MGEIFTVTLPDIGEGVVEGEVIEWLKKVGDTLKQDEPVVVVMTDKATVELPAPYPGKLAKQYHQPGQVAHLDKPLYDIELAPGIITTKPAKHHEASAKEVKKIPEPAVAAAKSIPQVNHRAQQTVPASHKALAVPSVRHLASQLGIDIHHVPGTGKDGRVTAEDLKQYQSGGKLQTALPDLPTVLTGDEEVPLIGIRHLMAKKMAESKAKIPHFSYFEQTEATRLIQLRENVKTKALEEGVRVTYMPFFIRALSLCIKQFPHLNSSLDMSNHKLIIHHQHNIGIAVATHHGLIVSVLKNVQDMSIDGIIRSYEDMIQKAKEGKLSSSDMKEATITISNFGVLGAGLWATPVINYPEVAILALSRIHKQPIVKNDAVAIRDMLNLSWSFDHRVIDGDLAAKISHHFCSLISNPAPLL